SAASATMPVPQMTIRWTRLMEAPAALRVIGKASRTALERSGGGRERALLAAAGSGHVQVLVGDQADLVDAPAAHPVHDLDHGLVREIVVGLEEDDLVLAPLHQLFDAALQGVGPADDLFLVQEDLRRLGGPLHRQDE